jgi:hypothetical protein
MDNVKYNFTYLDEVLTFLVDHNLKPQFELMGYPTKSNNTFKSFNFLNDGSGGEQFWYDLTRSMACRYIGKINLLTV